MSADTLVSYVSQLMYLIIFVTSIVRVVRQPRRVYVDIALLFGAIAVMIAASGILAAFGWTPTAFVNAVTNSLLMALPYLLARLVNDFTTVPVWIMRAGEAGLVLAVLGLFLVNPLPLWLALLYVAYFLGLEVYAAIVFVRQATFSPGLTRRRMQAAALGSLFLGLVILVAGLMLAFPGLLPFWTLLVRIFSLLSGVGYLLGFATPGWIRRSWQLPEIRDFLSISSRLPRATNTQAILRELEQGAALSLGATGSAISLWNEATHRLRITVPEYHPENVEGDVGTEYPVDPVTNTVELAPNQLVSGRVFATQRATFVEDIASIEPELAQQYRTNNANSLLGAPITTGNKRLGVLLVYGPRPALFAEDDLALLQLLADQAATILESRALMDEASRVRAREETAKLKEDFFSAAAHDLRTPLTALLSQTQLLRRRAVMNPDAPVDLRGLQRVEDETRRLIRFVNELLDVSRAEQGRLLGELESVDLVALASDLAGRPPADSQEIIVEAERPVVGIFDQTRIEQVLENLLENAVKYSPDGGDITVKVWAQNDTAHLTVRDHGIGIAPEELQRIFERFHRGANVNDRQFAGLGLGLFICRSIVEAHGGQIDAESTLGKGTAVHIVLPLHGKEGSGG